MYGHFRTKTQMKHTPGRYWKEAPIPLVSQDALKLNDPAIDENARLHQIRTGSVGGILLVTRLFDATGPITEPFITIVAAPSVVTYSADAADSGLILDDIWDENALGGFDPALVTSIPHCPVLTATEGYSRDTTLPMEVEHILLDAQPLLIPEGELLGTQVITGDDTFLRTFLFPEVCNLPLGLRWPTNIGFQEFAASIRAVLGKNSPPFEAVLQALKHLLEPWFNKVATDYQLFLVPGKQFLPLYDDHFPDIDTGAWPDSAPDPEAFSPIMEMLNGFVWRLWCDRILTTATVMNRNYLTSYLAIGEAAITPTTYLGATIPGRFCPNFAYHFRIDGWPTDSANSATAGFLAIFEHMPMISWQAQQHDRITVNLHQLAASSLLPIQTREQLSSAQHKARTPAYSAVPTPLGMVPKPPVPATLPTLPTRGLPGSVPATPQRPNMPAKYKDYTPSPHHSTTLSVASVVLPPNRRLILDEIIPAKHPGAVNVSRYNPLTATIYTDVGRLDVNDIFLNCCRLAAHHTTRFQLTDIATGGLIHSDSHIFVREPCTIFRTEILKPLQGAASSPAFLAPFQSFMEHLMRRARMDLTHICNPTFFSGEFLQALFSVESWMVSPHLQPADTPAKTFHVYRLLSSLRNHTITTLLLPADGLTLMDAKHLGVLTYHLFAMLDLTDTFEDTKFRRSLFGKRLKAWSELPDTPLVTGVWQQSPKQVTYYWFQSLQSLCLVFQTWIKNLRYHPTRGFIEARDQHHNNHLILDGTTPSPVPDRSDTLVTALQQYDIAFAARWYQTSAYDPSWTAPTPPGHFPAAAYVRPPPLREEKIPKKQRTEGLTARQKIPKDFICSAPLLEAVKPLRQDVPVSTQLLERIPKGLPYPKFPDPSGTCMTTICFRSAFASPQNCCATSLCKERRQPRQTRFHVDPTAIEWTSKPETYWAPLVAFLVDPQVSPILRPSQALKALTPSTNWP
jgi:hypothetical protein